jgi:anti-anti-sigma factor
MRTDGLRLAAEGNALVARLSGEIDMSNAEQLGEQIAEATPADSLGVVLDLTYVSYLDSYGIYVMFGLRERLAQAGKGLAVVVPPDSPIQPALRMANVSKRMEITPAVAHALRALASERSRTRLVP